MKLSDLHIVVLKHSETKIKVFDILGNDPPHLSETSYKETLNTPSNRANVVAKKTFVFLKQLTAKKKEVLITINLPSVCVSRLVRY